MLKKIFICLISMLFFVNSSYAYGSELLIFNELKLINKDGKKFKKIITNKKFSISEQALKNINDYKNNIKNNHNKNIKVLFSSNVSETIKKEELFLIQDALKFFQNYYYIDDLNGVIFTSDDIEWADNIIKNNIHSGWFGNIKKSYNKNEVCNFAFSMQQYGYAVCIDNQNRKIFDKQTSIHEIFHTVQAQNSNVPKSNNFGMPCWLLEGSATYLGSSIGIQDLSHMNIFINNLKHQFKDNQNNNILSKLKSKDAKIIMRNLESTESCDLTLAPYTMGYLATEILISKYGFEKFMIFIQSFNNNVDWKKDFELIFDLNIDLFYGQVIDHANNSLS